jgi:hypothetical protein
VLSGRNEHRAIMHFAACLHARGVLPIVETVMIVNISSHGARVITHRSWHPHDQLVLTELIGDFHIDAEVVYCQRLDHEECAVGLRFATAIEADWPAGDSTFPIRARPAV